MIFNLLILLNKIYFFTCFRRIFIKEFNPFDLGSEDGNFNYHYDLWFENFNLISYQNYFLYDLDLYSIIFKHY